MSSNCKTKWIGLRVTPEEKEQLVAAASGESMSVGDYLRKHIGRPQVRKTKKEREKLLQLARIGNNLNQIARWANMHKSGVDTVLLLNRLMEIREALRCL
ncbi:MAG: plasmid mobilization protein [Desulfovibrio sp.]